MDEDRAADMSKDIEDALGIYIIHKDKREGLERAIIKGRSAEVWFLRPLNKNIDDAKCDAFRWLFLGRMAENTGVIPLFKKYPELDQVTLVFYGVETRVRSDRRGGYIQDRTPVRHLEVTIERTQALALDPKGLTAALKSSRESCISQGQKLSTNHWYIR